MSVLDFLDSDIFTTAFSGDVPLVSNARIDAICRELMYSIKNNETIFVYGDYDMDGFCCVKLWQEVLSLIGSKPPATFKYINRTHNIDGDIVRQVCATDARVVIICDTGSAVVDQTLTSILQSRGRVPIVIDHHVYEGDYIADCSYRLMFNSFEERGSLNQEEISGAYASLLVAKVLCEKFIGCALAFNAKVYALASMYSDCVDMSSSLGRALYSAVCASDAKGPVFLTALNKWDYYYGRRFFSFIVAPKLNGCFRMGRFDILNKALVASDKFQCKSIAEDLQVAHGDARVNTKMLVPEFKRFHFRGIVVCVCEVTDELRLHQVRGFTGVIASQIAQEEKSMVVVVVHDNNMYSGSYRDYYGREMLEVFSLFSTAVGHPSAFGISFSSLSEFTRYIKALSSRIDEVCEKPYIALNSGVLVDDADFAAVALYNEYMNRKPRVIVTHVCSGVKLIRSTKWNKYYSLGLNTNRPLVTSRHLLDGMKVLVEPAICRGVELREMV